MRPSKYFYDKPLPKYLDSKTVPKKAFFSRWYYIKCTGKLGRGGRAGWGRWRWGGDPNSDKNFDERSRVAILF